MGHIGATQQILALFLKQKGSMLSFSFKNCCVFSRMEQETQKSHRDAFDNQGENYTALKWSSVGRE